MRYSTSDGSVFAKWFKALTLNRDVIVDLDAVKPSDEYFVWAVKGDEVVELVAHGHVKMIEQGLNWAKDHPSRASVLVVCDFHGAALVTVRLADMHANIVNFDVQNRAFALCDIAAARGVN